MTIAIIGAGLSAAALCRTLRPHGLRLAVFEKARGPGGRLATRRHEEEGRSFQFDHGSPLLAASEGDPFAILEGAGDAGLWWRHPQSGVRGLVGQPGMNVLVRRGLGPVPQHYGAEISALERDGARWLLHDRNAVTHGPFECVLSTVPAPQAASLLAPVHERFSELARAADYDPVWTVMLAYRHGTDLSFLAPRVDELPGADAIIHDGGKPGRGDAPTLLVHMMPQWSLENLERDKPQIAGEIAALLGQVFSLPEPVLAIGHRWRHARVRKTAPRAAIFDRDSGLGIAGDWLIGPDAEDAWASGVLLANTVSRLHAWGVHSG